jgi:hypothetical protein
VKTTQGFEVDFQAGFPSGEENLIQVCADAGAHTVERELRGTRGGKSPRARKILLTIPGTVSRAGYRTMSLRFPPMSGF